MSCFFEECASWQGALSIYVKNPEISVGTKMDFPTGKKLSRNGAEPVTRWDTKMAAELVTIETGIKYKKRVNGTRNSFRKIPTGKTGLPF